MDDLRYELGGMVIGAAGLSVWIGGMIVGGDWFAARFGKRAGDVFSLTWSLGWPLAIVALYYLNG